MGGGCCCPHRPGGQAYRCEDPPTGPPPGPLCPLSATFLWAAGGRLAAPDLGTPASIPPHRPSGALEPLPQLEGGVALGRGSWTSLSRAGDRQVGAVSGARGSSGEGGSQGLILLCLQPGWAPHLQDSASSWVREGLLPAEALGEGSSRCRAGAAVPAPQLLTSSHTWETECPH